MRGNWVHEPLLRGFMRLIPRHCRVLDIGSGPGHYVCALQSCGWLQTRGIDGTRGIETVTHGNICRADLTAPLTSWHGWADWGICLEVGEHIDPQHEAALLDNLAALPRHGLALSWSTRPGFGHVNLRSEGYVAQALGQRGWLVDDKASQLLTNCRGRAFKSWVLVLRRSAGGGGYGN